MNYMEDDGDCMVISFKSESDERTVEINKHFHEGTTWRQIVPVFKEFLSGVGYSFPAHTEFVLMPIKE